MQTNIKMTEVEEKVCLKGYSLMYEEEKKP